MSSCMRREGDIASSTTSNMAWKAIYFWRRVRATYPSLVLTAMEARKRRAREYLTRCGWSAGSRPLGSGVRAGVRWRKRVGVEPTGDIARCRPPVLKTGTITGPHALPSCSYNYLQAHPRLLHSYVQHAALPFWG